MSRLSDFFTKLVNPRSVELEQKAEDIKKRVPCPRCTKPLRFYNITFDQGYTCDYCGGLFETYDERGVRRDFDPQLSPVNQSTTT